MIFNCLLCDHLKWISLLICVHEYNIQIQIMFGQSKKIFWALLPIYNKKWWLIIISVLDMNLFFYLKKIGAHTFLRPTINQLLRF